MQVLDGRYALVPNEEPRSGVMAEIRRAVDMVDGQKSVATKLFKPDIDADRLHLEAYSRECGALQRLDHPNIAAHPLAGWDTFYETIGRPVLDGLTYAYGQDILHRDLKPQNVLFSPDGVIKVALTPSRGARRTSLSTRPHAQMTVATSVSRAIDGD